MDNISKHKVNLSDVARAAGVSRAAAGKVLNNCNGAIRVSLETKKRIEEAAQKLNYHPNIAAQMLAGGQSKLIGVLTDTHSNYRYIRLMKDIENIAFKKHYRLIASCTHDNIVDMKENYYAMQRYGVKGIICLAHDYPTFRKEVEELFSNVDNVVFMGKPKFPVPRYVTSCNKNALIQLFAHWKNTGRKKIALACGNTQYISESNLVDNFITALKVNNLNFDENLLASYHLEHDVLEDCKNVITNVIEKHKPDAIFIDDAQHAICLQNLLQYHKWNIPEDLIIHGGDGDLSFNYIYPAIKSFDPCYEKIATKLIDAVINPNIKCNEVVETIY